MMKARFECDWCRELVAAGADRPAEGFCTGQPFHALHQWTRIGIRVRSRMPFETERKFPPASPSNAGRQPAVVA
jgi:hypothetical protein